MTEFLPFAAILWGATVGFGVVGAGAAWSLRASADALIMPRLSGTKKRALLSLPPPSALLVASLVTAYFLGSNILANFFVGTLAASASIALGYLFSEDWRRLILAQLNRARIVVGCLTMAICAFQGETK
jgi:hypothetical protein